MVRRYPTHFLVDSAWIALEDIHIDSGPLSFVPGSHRLPYHTFDNDGIIMHAPGVTQEQKKTAVNKMSQDIERENMPIRKFTAKKGEVFFWHGSLAHGGSPVRNPELTRKSLVVHFDDISCHPRRGSTVRKEDGTEHQVYTGQLMTNRNNVGFECPIRLANQVAYSEYQARDCNPR